MRFGTALFLGLGLCLLLLLHGSSSEPNKKKKIRHRAARTWSHSLANPFVPIEYFSEPKTSQAHYRSLLGNNTVLDYEMFWSQERTLLAHEHLKLLSISDPGAIFFKKCIDIFKQTDLVAYIVKGVLDELTKRLEQHCADKGLHPLSPKIVAGSLYCNSNMHDTMDMLLDLLLDQVERNCEAIPGYHGIFMFSR
ncbi:uncharacterized protein LOC111079148 [Drosophila obscura]|uniref:uncharacterized protein LOC111079148 n=1 Tax=Drosophila obscura TaxID=7282 RepID=UPI001BB2C160|nr:uncharacterized protein LOC111079148 [Drosophila obscura]